MNTEELIRCGQNVLNTEIEALQKLSQTLGQSFADACLEIYNTKGRVIVTGMGKSGHIGRKIAATLASVGTPAFFVHPGEASHGDLGMITPDDVILALSNSGESKELNDIIAFSRRFGIRMICMVGVADSTLGRASDIIICYPPFEEACSFGMAPTTSTTLSLAMGDALAMTLLEMKGFTKDNYRDRHPGGKLGAMLLKATDLMAKGENMPIVSKDTPMSEALITMTAKSLGCVGVLDEVGTLIGIITDGDLRRHINDLMNKKASDVMTTHPKTISPDLLASSAVKMMNDHKITSLFVVQDNKPIGLLHIHSCLSAGVI